MKALVWPSSLHRKSISIMSHSKGLHHRYARGYTYLCCWGPAHVQCRNFRTLVEGFTYQMEGQAAPKAVEVGPKRPRETSLTRAPEGPSFRVSSGSTSPALSPAL